MMNMRDVAEALVTNDWKKMIECMRHFKDFPGPFGGENQDGEHVIISVHEHSIVKRTLQSNNWCRVNVYYDNGCCEELYER